MAWYTATSADAVEREGEHKATPETVAVVIVAQTHPCGGRRSHTEDRQGRQIGDRWRFDTVQSQWTASGTMYVHADLPSVEVLACLLPYSRVLRRVIVQREGCLRE